MEKITGWPSIQAGKTWKYTITSNNCIAM